MRLWKSLAAAALALLLHVLPAGAGQATYTMPLTGPSTFSDFLNNSLNPALAAVLTNNSGATAPAVTGQPGTYQWWADTSGSPIVLKVYDGSAWLSIATIDAAGDVLSLTGGSVTVTGSTAPTNGLYLPAANTLGFAANSAGEVRITGTATSPNANDGNALGTSSLGWSDAFLATGAVVDIGAGNWIATHTSGILTVGTGDLRITTAGTNTASAVTVGGTQTLTSKTLTSPVLNTPTVGTSILPTANDAAAIGASGTAFSDLFLASGAVIDYAAGNWVATHTSGILTVGTGDLRVTTAGTNTASVATVGGTQTLTSKTLTSPVLNTPTVGTSLLPSSNDGAALGASGTAWADLFLASGGVINFAAGDWAATHTSGVLTVGTGDLRVSTAGTNGASVVTIGGTQTLTSKTLTTPVLNGAPTGTGVATAATASTLALRDANANVLADNFPVGYTTTATAAGTTTLTVDSTYWQFFTGATTQTVTLPVASTLTQGHEFGIVNNSTGAVTVNSSGGNAVIVLAAGTWAKVTDILTSGTSAASWNALYQGVITTSAKKLTVSNTLTLAGTDSTTMTFPTTSATIARTDAANTFTGVQTMTSPALTTPVITGVATGTGVAAGATASTLGLRDANANLSSNAFLPGFTTTATAAGTTTLTVASTQIQVFTGATTQTVVMPVASTVVQGQYWTIINQSSGALTVNSSGGNLILTIAAGNTGIITDVLTSGTSAASWQATYISSGAGTGTVTSVTCNGGLTGGTFTTTGTCALDSPVSRANGGTQSTGGAFIKIVRQVFTADGTYTPTTGMMYADVEAVGGGAGGGGVASSSGNGSGGGGGGGAYVKKVVTAADIGASKAVDIGALGTGGGAGDNDGNNGASTTLGTTIVVAAGGAKGDGAAANSNATGGAGGATGTGDYVIPGGPGSNGLYNTGATIFLAQLVNGGNSGMNMGQGGRATINATAAAGTGYGAGGGGARNGGGGADQAGGAGTAGIMIITEYVNQ